MEPGAGAASDTRAAPALAPLSIPVFRDLWTAAAVSNIGSQVQLVAAAWLMGTLTSSPLMIALVHTSINLPVMLFVLLGGAMADNMDRRRLMLLSQSGMLTGSAALTALTWCGVMTPWLLLGFTFSIAVGGALNNPAWQASVRDIVPRGSISRAVALNSTSVNLARTLGPVVGGAIVGIGGVAVAFFVNVLSFLGLIVVLLRWRPAGRAAAAPRERLSSAIVTGVRYAALSPHIRAVVLRGAMSSFSASAAFALMPVVARQELAQGPLLYGLLLAAFGTGAVTGALSGGRLRGRYTAERLVRVAAIFFAGGLLLIAMTRMVPVAALGAGCSGFGWVLAHSSFNTTVQLSAPRWVSARALALYQTATFGAMALGGSFFGLMAERVGVSNALLIAGSLQALGGALGLLLPLPVTDTLDLDPLDCWKEPDFDRPAEAEHGPLLIEIEYRISGEDTTAFRAAMVERARIRRRDGARDWSLWRDLQDGSRWVESYKVRNWADYIRHNQRRTRDDAQRLEALHRFHTGAPSIRWLVRMDPDAVLVRPPVRPLADEAP